MGNEETILLDVLVNNALQGAVSLQLGQCGVHLGQQVIVVLVDGDGIVLNGIGGIQDGKTGIGIGGNSEQCALLAKRALLRPLDEHNPDPLYREMEERLLERINKLGIGPQGLGGTVTALAVSILPAATHIAQLPICVNLCCHVCRHASAFL